jgi:hypothetical protein
MLQYKSNEEIKTHRWVGNFGADGPAIGAIDAFLLNPATTDAQRKEALDIMSLDPLSDDELNRYIDELKAAAT